MGWLRNLDPRQGWAVCIAIFAVGFVLAMPTDGWLDVIAGALLVIGSVGNGVFIVLNRRRVPPEKRTPWWSGSWRDWNERANDE